MALQQSERQSAQLTSNRRLKENTSQIAAFSDVRRWWSMDQLVLSRLERLQAGATKNEQDLVRLRHRIEDLRFDGHRTTEAEAVFRRFEATHQGLLAKLDALRREQAAAD
jgi:hypothetical protein